MGRTEAKSGLAAKRPMATTSGASPPRDVSVLSMVADLEGRDLDGLRRQWRAHLGGEAPAHLPRWLLMRVLAYQLQSNAFGGLDKTIRRNLRSDKDDAAVPFDRRAPQTRQSVALKAGALLVREWKGRLERVMILEEGFAWNGQTFGSLSQIAKAMTGTNWERPPDGGRTWVFNGFETRASWRASRPPLELGAAIRCSRKAHAGRALSSKPSAIGRALLRRKSATVPEGRRATPDPCPPRESLLARSAGVDQWPGRPSPSLSRGRINASFRSGFRAALLFSGETLCAANLLRVYRPLVKALFHYAAALRRPGGRNFSTSGSTSSGPRITSSNSRPAIMP